MSALPPIADINGYGEGCPLMTQSGHSPTDPEARLHHQNWIRCADPLVSMPTAEGPTTEREDKAEEMEVRAKAIRAKHARENPVE